MRAILLGIFVLVSVVSSAQTNPALPLPIEAKWVYYNVPSAYFWKDEFPQPTIIPGDTTVSYEFAAEEIVCGEGYFCGCASSMKNIKQIGNKWYLNNILYFDWDSQVGDTILFVGSSYPDGQNYIIDYMDTITTPDFVQRRTYHLLVPWVQPYVPYMNGVEFYFIEGIGATCYGLDYLFVDDRISVLTCFYDKNGLEIYHQDFATLDVYDCCYYVGVGEAQGMLMQLFPSPASDHITLQFGNGPLPTEVKIFNSLGALVQIEAVNGRQQLQLNTSNFASGVYTVVAQGADGVVGKFVRE